MIWVLLGLNILVYVAWQLAMRAGRESPWIELMADHFMVSLPGVESGRVWTLLTSAFSHLDPMHLFVNMLALWVFGRGVHRVIGTAHFVHLYVVGALLASAGHVLFSVLAESTVPALGASGSVMAIAVVFAGLYPKRVLLLNFFIPVPAALAVAAYILLDVFGALGGVMGQASQVAHAAHLGGAAYGLAYWAVWARRKK